jgi:hypothetical protein
MEEIVDVEGEEDVDVEVVAVQGDKLYPICKP